MLGCAKTHSVLGFCYATPCEEETDLLVEVARSSLCFSLLEWVFEAAVSWRAHTGVELCIIHKCCTCAAVIICATGLFLNVNTGARIPPSLQGYEHLLHLSEVELTVNYRLNCCKRP